MFRRKSVLEFLLGIIFVSFFGTLAVSASMFPGHYDWRYRVISNLLSPRDNPAHYWLPVIGVTIAGLSLLPFARHLEQRLKVISRWGAKVTGLGFLLGGLGLVCAALIVPQHVHAALGLRRPHELLARAAAGFIALGMIAACWCAVQGCGHLLPWPLVWTWVLLTLLPLSGLLCSELLFLFTHLRLAWAGPVRSLLKQTVFWHLGFWEWSGAVAVFLFLCASVFLMPPIGRETNASL